MVFHSVLYAISALSLGCWAFFFFSSFKSSTDAWTYVAYREAARYNVDSFHHCAVRFENQYTHNLLNGPLVTLLMLKIHHKNQRFPNSPKHSARKDRRNMGDDRRNMTIFAYDITAKTTEVPQIQYPDRDVDAHAVSQRQIAMVQKLQDSVGVPQAMLRPLPPPPMIFSCWECKVLDQIARLEKK